MEKGFDTNNSFDYWWKDLESTHIQEKKFFCDSLITFLEGRVNRDEIEEIFESFCNFLERINKKKHPLLKSKALKPFKKIINRKLRIKIYSVISLIQNLIFQKKNPYISEKDFIKSIDDWDISYNKKQLNLFLRSVCK